MSRIGFEPGMDASPFEADHPPSREGSERRYFLDDSGGDLAMWRDNGEFRDPTLVAYHFEDAKDKWRLLVRGAGLDPEAVCVSREDLRWGLRATEVGAVPREAEDAVERLTEVLNAEVQR